MWRSNVLRLRKCSSPTTLRNGVNIRCNSSGKSLLVTEKEFQDALEEVLPWQANSQNNMPLGFAISGGVDSMALAALYARALKTNRSLPQAHGFIVDHKVRPESTDEAEWVQEQLRRKFGMEASILTLTWPENFDMLDLNRFESEARALRYQALGRACRDKRIQALMVAHHGDDQAETVMMRLANKRLRSGLKAMQSADWIPECEGIYGVYHSGKMQVPGPSLDIPFPVAHGGIRILRPLLNLEKSRLIATCKELNVSWAEDKSNQLQTLTSRNAIRHICRNYNLPEALSVKSLVDVSRKISKRIRNHKVYAEELFDQCLMKLDIQTGSLLVRFPPFSALLARSIQSQSDRHEAANNAYCLMHRIVTLVSPKFKGVDPGILAQKVDDIYPEFRTWEEVADSAFPAKEPLRNSFTVHGVWWRPWDKRSPFENNGLIKPDFGSTAPHPKEWLLLRQSLENGEAKKSSLQISFPPSHTTSRISSKSTYQLFDGRFWIKINNYTMDTLMVRVFQKQDMQHLPTKRSTKTAMIDDTNNLPPERFLNAALSLLKPSDIRFTLPAVFAMNSQTGEETLVGFPTLDVRLDGFGSSGGTFDWSVQYKKCDFGVRSAADIILPGTKQSDVMAEERRLRKAARTGARGALAKNRFVDPAVGELLTTGYKKGKSPGGMTGKMRGGAERRSNSGPRDRRGEDYEALQFLDDRVKKHIDGRDMKKQKRSSTSQDGIS